MLPIEKKERKREIDYKKTEKYKKESVVWIIHSFLRVCSNSVMNLNDSQEAYGKVYTDEPHHKKNWTHELVAAAAGFAGKSRLRHRFHVTYKNFVITVKHD